MLLRGSLIAALLAPFVATGVYVYMVKEHSVRIRETLVGYIVGVVVSGALLGLAGMFVGPPVICALTTEMSCGFGGSLLGAPLGLAIGISAFIFLWAKRRVRNR